MMYQLCTTVLLMTLPCQTPASGQETAIQLDDYAPCGITTLYLVCKIRGNQATWGEVKEAMGQPGPDGELNFAEMAGAAEKIGLHPVALQAGRVALNNLPMPAIVQVHDSRFPDELPHFLVLLRPEIDGVWLLDAPFPAYFLPEERFQQSWTGRVLVFAQDEEEVNRIRGTASRYGFLKSATWILLLCGLLAIGYVVIRWMRHTGSSAAIRIAKVAQAIGGPRQLPAWTLIVIFFVGGVFAAMLVRKHTKIRPPECVFADAIIELGELKPGGQKTLVSIQNNGDELLEIAEIQSSCSCAVAKHPTVVPPHDSGNIEVELNAGPGPGGAYLTVLSNDPAGPKHVSLRWHGKTEPFLNPRWIAENGVRLDWPYERTVHLLYPGGKSAIRPKLEGVECSDPSVEVRAGSDDPLATKFATSGLLTKILGQLELHLTVRPPPNPTTVRTVCNLKIKYGEAHLNVRLPILLAFSGGQLSPSATSVTFSAASREEILSQVRSINVTDLETESELEVSGLPKWLACKVDRKTSRESVIHVRLQKVPEAALAQEILTITRKNGPKTAIPLRVNVLTPSS